MENEIWKPIVGYEGQYEVSNMGRIRSLDRVVFKLKKEYLLKGKILKLQINELRYCSVNLWKNSKGKTYHVHRLVATAFIPNPDNLPYINHRDENPSNNKAENLEWCTPKYNNTYGTRIERMAKSNINNPKISKKVLQFTKEGEFIKEWPSIAEIIRHYNWNKSHIANACRKYQGYNTAYGYVWKYKNAA